MGMETVINLAERRHARASADSGFKNASIGTVLPDKRLKRSARPRDASLRPAKILRKCASEQPTAAASCLTERPLAEAQASMGCESDICLTIPARNGKSQDTIFPPEIAMPQPDLLKSDMAKRNPPPPREIFLGDWLTLAGIGPTEAAKIAGCSQSYISNIARGERNHINALYLLRLSEHLKISMNDFFRKPPTLAQVAPLAELSPEAQAMLLRPRRQKRG